MGQNKKMNRRKFISSTAATVAITVVPRYVLGGLNYVAPSDKINLAYIGCGTQGIREMVRLIGNPEIQIVAVCDPNTFTTDYVDWSLNGIRNGICNVLEEPNWGKGIKGIPGGRKIGKEIVEKYYAKKKAFKDYKGCNAYADFRELLDKEKDIDAVKIMTPDHLHATIAIAAMKKGKHVVIHKPIANRVYEARLAIETARKTGVTTHLLAWSKRKELDLILNWIRDGAIGKLREIHNWSNRPVWPQWTANPRENPSVPKGFDWDLWLGCVPHRPYHPNYTHAVFRGWYDFGAGSVADMGTYSLWPLFLTFGFNKSPISVNAYGTTTSAITNHVSRPHSNKVAFPHSCTFHYKFPSQGEWDPLDIFWYDGGMKPQLPDEMDADKKEFPGEGMMFVGGSGKILAGFRGEKPQIIPKTRMEQFSGPKKVPESELAYGDNVWINSMKNSKQSPGSFLYAQAVTDTILLSAVALRAGRKIEFDSEKMEITNIPEANKYLHREYRKGWEL